MSQQLLLEKVRASSRVVVAFFLAASLLISCAPNGHGDAAVARGSSGPVLLHPRLGTWNDSALPVLSYTLLNDSEQVYYFSAFAAGKPLAVVERATPEGWEAVGAGLCGTGRMLFPLVPGESLAARVLFPRDSGPGPFRVTLRLRTTIDDVHSSSGWEVFISEATGE